MLSNHVILQCLMNRRLAGEKQRNQQQTLSGSSVSNSDVLTSEVHRDVALVTRLSLIQPFLYGTKNCPEQLYICFTEKRNAQILLQYVRKVRADLFIWLSVTRHKLVM